MLHSTHHWLFGCALGLAALIGGCASTPGKSVADGYVADGKYEEADQAYAKAMQGRITDQEWQWAAESRCEMRRQWIAAKVDGKKTGDLAVAELERLERLALNCPGAGDELGRVKLMLAQTADAELTRKLRGVDNAWTKLETAAPYMHNLPAEHPKWAWYREVADRAAARYRRAAKDAPTELERLYFEHLAAAIRAEDDPGTLQQHAEAFVSVHHDQIELSMDASCKAVLGSKPAQPGEEHGERYAAKASFTHCAANSYTTTRQEKYYKTEYRTEVVEKWVYVKVPVYGTSYAKTCLPGYCMYNSVSSGKVVGYKAEKTKKLVEEQVPYQVPAVRTVTDTHHKVHAQLDVTVTSKSGQTTRKVRLDRIDEARQALLDTPEEEVRTVADAAARQMLVERLKAEWAGVEADPMPNPRARQLAVALWVTGELATPATARVLRQLAALPDGALADHALPSIAALSPPPDRVPFRGFTDQPHRSPNGVLSLGFPVYALSLGANYRIGDELPVQGRRTAASGELGVKMEGSWTTGEQSRGFGLHSVLDTRLHVGRRTSDPWVYPDPFQYAKDEPQQEWKLAAGFRITGGIFAGGRARKVALFAGPQIIWHGGFMGDYTTAGFDLPVAIVAELRLIERYPIRARLWGLDLRGGDTQSMGGRLEVAFADDLWIFTEYERNDAPTQVSGLRVGDEVDAGTRPLTSASAGIMTSMFSSWF